MTAGTALVQRRDYLAGQRRTIIARSLIGSLAGALPLPFLDDWAVARILGGGYERIAAAHHVDLHPDAVNALVHGATKPPTIANIAIGGVLARVASLAARRMMVAIAAINRARSAARTYTAMTLFDHYCAKLHTGLELDGPTALLLREEIIRSIDQTPGALAFHPFRRAALSAARATVRAPLELVDLVSGGRLRKMLAAKSESSGVAEPEHIDDIELAMEAALADKNNFLARTVASVEAQLSSEVNPFLDAAIESLDRRWRARVAAKR
ncbi:MAG TPA: hypothetical protein VMZ53_19250 [Kofleriaceae bacterium]|nr:hypothetical protein [Kofleriaceae bacterium]